MCLFLLPIPQAISVEGWKSPEFVPSRPIRSTLHVPVIAADFLGHGGLVARFMLQCTKAQKLAWNESEHPLMLHCTIFLPLPVFSLQFFGFPFFYLSGPIYISNLEWFRVSWILFTHFLPTFDRSGYFLPTSSSLLPRSLPVLVCWF